jgi:hypothetical protein
MWWRAIKSCVWILPNTAEPILFTDWSHIYMVRILSENNPEELFGLSVLSQFYKHHFFSLAQTCVHSYAITSRTKQAVYTNFQLWIDKTATFTLTPRGVTSGLTLTVSCVLNRPSWPMLRGLSPGMGGKQTFCWFPQVWLGRCRGSDW